MQDIVPENRKLLGDNYSVLWNPLSPASVLSQVVLALPQRVLALQSTVSVQEKGRLLRKQQAPLVVLGAGFA